MISLDDRMKNYYEKVWNFQLPMRLPAIIRIDGKNFHSFTRKLDRPFDPSLKDAMTRCAAFLCKEIATSQLAYVQSDEISILLHPYKKLDSQAWFANEIQKMVSVSAGLASAFMSVEFYNDTRTPTHAVFDSRVFVLPETEVVNYFLWRQQDASKNSVSMWARSMFSHKELQGKHIGEMQEMMMEKENFNWNNAPTWQKRGFCVVKKAGQWIEDDEIPLFSQKRNYIERLLRVEEE